MALYRSRYLLAVYDRDDFIVGVYDNVKELCEALGCKDKTVYDALYRQRRSLHLIDVFEVGDDDFKETDMSLLCLYQKGLLTDRHTHEIAEDAGCSERTVYRKKGVLKGGV